MPQYAAFLRGMNIGKRRLKNEELARHFQELGFSQVQTFLASGNVLFQAQDDETSAVQARIEAGLRQALGYEVPTFLRSGPRLREIAALEPFDAALLAQTQGKHQVALLQRSPGPQERARLASVQTGQDWLHLGPQELHWLPQSGLSDSRLDLTGLERLLGPMTVRTRRTVTRMVDKYLG